MPTNAQFDAAILLSNPFSLQTQTGVLGSKDEIKLYKVAASSSDLNARLSLTELSGNALLRVYNSDHTLVQGGESNQPSRLSESILLNKLASGTYYIEVALDPDPAVTSASYKLNVEFNANVSRSNIFWRNDTLQQAGIWQIAGTTLSGSAAFDGVDASWQTQGFADFDGDGEEDIVWRNLNSGDVGFWFLKDNQIADISVVKGVSLDWQIKHTANLDGNKYADLVWQQTSTGDAGLWLMQGGTILNAGAVPLAPGWSVQKVGDFDGDNRDDLFWRSPTGDIAIFLLDGITNVGASPAIKVSTEWKVQFVADLDGNGTEDLIWRNEQTGSVGLWLMDGLQHSATREIPTGGVWRVEQTGDFNGDGKADLVWRNVNGELAVVLMDGLTSVSTSFLPSVGQEWKVEQVTDFNSDGKDDLLWRSESLQSAGIWLLNATGTTVDFLRDGNGAPLAEGYNNINAGWKIQGILERKLTSEPFSISGSTLQTAFNIGTLDDAGKYQDKIAPGESDFYKFSIAIQTDLTASISGGALELYKNVNGVWTKQTYQAGTKQTIEMGDYYVQVSSASGVMQPTTYTLDILGVPRRVDLLGTSFAFGQTSIVLDNDTPANNKVSATFQVKNLQAFAPQDFKVKFYISRDAIINPYDITPVSGDQQLTIALNGTQQATISGKDLLVTKQLGKNDVFDGTITLTLPDVLDGFWTTDKPYYIGMAINSDNLQYETNPANNYNVDLGIDKSQLGVSNIPTTDLTGKSLSGATLNNTFQPGATVPLQYVIENLGNKPASTSFKVAFYASLDATIDTNDFLVDSKTVTEIIGKKAISSTLTAQAILPDKNTWEALANLYGKQKIYLGMYVNSDPNDLAEPERNNNLNRGAGLDLIETYIDLGSAG